MGDFDRYARLTAGLDAPYAVIDLAAFRRNTDDLIRRAAGTPIRIASKSVRCRALIATALDIATEAIDRRSVKANMINDTERIVLNSGARQDVVRCCTVRPNGRPREVELHSWQDCS